MAYRLLHKKSNVSGKTPTPDQLEYGELAINYNAESPQLHIKNSDNEIVNFIDENKINDKFNGKQDTLISGVNIKKINNIDILGDGNINITGGSDAPIYNEGTGIILDATNNTISVDTTLVALKSELPIVNLTYESLLDAISANDGNGELVSGQKYRITDYVTTTSQEGTKSAGIPFDIIVEAIEPNKLSENAKAVKNSDNSYFENNKLDAWEIKYCVTNDTSRFAWADTTNGKGVIYYMKDEFNNECWYDFKNIQFECVVKQTHNNQEVELRLDDYDYAYTFTDYNGNDLSLTPNARNNSIKRYTTSGNGLQSLNNTVFICSAVHNNIIEENSYFNVFYVNSCYYNTIGKAFQNNFISAPSSEDRASIHNNIIGNLFKKNRIQSTFDRNVIGNTTTSCDFFNAFAFNKLGNNSWHIDFNYPISYCEFGSYIQYCIFNNTDAYSPVVNEMKWCYIEDGLEGAQYFPCCQMVTVQSRSLFNSSNNFHINDIELIDGRKLAEALTQEHTEHLYVYKAGDKHAVSSLSEMQKSKSVNLPTLVSNPGTLNDNANNYGYVGTLQNIGVTGDIIVVDTITSYVRIGTASPNSTTPVWCRLLKFVNNTWKIVYQSINSKKIGDYSADSSFSFKMEQKGNDTITSNDKIAIVYSTTDDITNIFNSTQLGLRAISNKTGGLNNELANNSLGATNYQTALSLKYLSMANTPVNAVTIENSQTITSRKQFNSGISISDKSLITSSIDSGELKVLHNNSTKGFIIRTKNNNANLFPLELVTTNGSAFYQYNFQSKNGTVAHLDDVNSINSSTKEQIDTEINSLKDKIEYKDEIIANALVYLNEIIDIKINNLKNKIYENEEIVTKTLININNRLKEIEKKLENN